MIPLFVKSEADLNNTCYESLTSSYDSSYCQAQIRNLPYEGWTPSLVAWPINSSQVSLCLKFALKHNLCVMVAGTGHDFMNRHSCKNGIFIRTTFLKNIEWDLTDTKGYGNPDGNVKFGAGIVFSEAHQSAATMDRVISSGWASTVGVVGWSIGGGHGPFAPSLGLGVDNILEIQMVDAKGNQIIVNSTSNSDLFWAIRGGGGSTWGIVTAITYKAHKIPVGGFVQEVLSWNGTFCLDGQANLTLLFDRYVNWSLSLNQSWGGLAFFTPSVSTEVGQCGGTWKVDLIYNYVGSNADSGF